jgi:cytochrome c553
MPPRFALFALALGLCAGRDSCLAEDDPKLMNYGRHLAQECTGCHRLDGASSRIPSIVGWDARQFAATMEFYRTGERNNPVMVSVAKSLDADQIRALAAYYASLPKPAKK